MIAAQRKTVAEREAAAGAPGLSLGEQVTWALDGSARVRRVVASRQDLTADAALRLATDRDRQVRERLAANTACPPEILITLLGDLAFAVRWEAAQNPAATVEVHRAALAASNSDVAEAIGQLGDTVAPEIIEALVRHPLPAVRKQLAAATASPAVLQRLARDQAPLVRGTVALSEAAPGELLRQLAGDPNAKVRAAVACAPRTPRELLFHLAGDRSTEVRWWVLVMHEGDRALVARMVQDPDTGIAGQAQHTLDVLDGLLPGWPDDQGDGQ